MGAGTEEGRLTLRALRERFFAATFLNGCRAGDTYYLVVCPTRGEFAYFGGSPQGAIAALDRHTDDANYEEVVVYALR